VLENGSLSYAVEDDKIASISPDGRISPLSSGATQVIIQADTVKLAVPVKVSLPARIILSVPQITLTSRISTLEVHARVVDEQGEPWLGQPQFSWTSADPHVVSVNEGRIDAHHSGTTIVTVSFGTLKKEIPATVLLEDGALYTL